MTRLNQLAHQKQACMNIVREQMERQMRIEQEIADLLGVSILGGYQRATVEDFTVEVTRCMNRAPHVTVEERHAERRTLEAAGAACVDVG